ncbi:MAG: hypothetical protein EBR86_15885 [Planctomycetia bacterium]|nr:hypothetical protein [Planctomycetia bacterium]
MATPPTTAPPTADTARRHDLDSLRALAMLLGIALHAALSFFPGAWPVQDSRQSPLYGLFVGLVHGFRMPLFFLVSGCFTMLVYRRRGLAALLRQRAARILAPLALSLVTVVPLLWWSAVWVQRPPGRAAAPDTLVAAIRAADEEAITRFLADPDRRAARDAEFFLPPLQWAVLLGDEALVARLLDAGADVAASDRQGNTALHSAAFMGRPALAKLLVDRGADPTVRNESGLRPVDATATDGETTEFILRLLRLPPIDAEDLAAGRAATREWLVAVGPGPAAGPVVGTLVDRYRAWLASPRFTIRLGRLTVGLFTTPVLQHLWFLWYLCWLVMAFAVWARFLDRGPGPGRAAPWCVALTPVPQWFMAGLFGPDTATGLLPAPHLLVYYGLFFACGAAAFSRGDGTSERLASWSRRPWLMLALAILVAFPAGFLGGRLRPAGVAAQAAYPWLVSLALVGLSGRWCNRARPTVRFVADASYWMYLMHMPLVIAGQGILRDVPWPGFAKFLLLVVVVTSILLVSYRLIVRDTWIGRLLSGPRRAPTA